VIFDFFGGSGYLFEVDKDFLMLIALNFYLGLFNVYVSKGYVLFFNPHWI
jgi:hypothetical protein